MFLLWIVYADNFAAAIAELDGNSFFRFDCISDVTEYLGNDQYRVGNIIVNVCRKKELGRQGTWFASMDGCEQDNEQVAIWIGLNNFFYEEMAGWREDCDDLTED